MRLRNLLGILIVLLVTQVIVTGQAATPSAPWPPDPEAIFEDGVQWEAFEPQVSGKRFAYVDYEKAVINLYDSSVNIIRSFSFPPGETSLHSAYLTPDGFIQVKREGIEGDTTGSQSFVPGNVLLLDPETGEYSEPPTVCEGRAIQTYTGTPQWRVVAYDNEQEDLRLCDTETGKALDVLPDRFGFWEVFQSPNPNWLLLIGQDQGGITNFVVLSYDLESETLRILGEISENVFSEVGHCSWITETTGLFCQYPDQYYLSNTYYTFNLAQSRSLKPVFRGREETIFSSETQNRYGAVTSDNYFTMFTGSLSTTHSPCTLHTIDSDGVHKTELGYECLTFIHHNGILYDFFPYFRSSNMLYFLTTKSADSTVSSLKSYDIEANTVTDLQFSGELESILSVSPDNRYIVLSADDDGRIVFPVDFNYFIPLDGEGSPIVIFDRLSGRIVYHTENLGVYISNQVFWLNSSTVIIASLPTRQYFRVAEENDSILYQPQPSLQKITFNIDNTIDTVISTDYGIYNSNNGQTFDGLYKGCYWLHAGYSVVNLYTFQEKHLIRETALATYEIVTGFDEDNRLRISITPKEAELSSPTVTYTVTLPDCSAPQIR